MPPHRAFGVLDRIGAVLAGADPDSVLNTDDEDLSVAHLAGPSPSGHCQLVHHRAGDLRLHHGLDLESRPKRDVHGPAAIRLRVATLGAATFDLGDGDA